MPAKTGQPQRSGRGGDEIADGRPGPMACVAPWPAMRPDGTLVVPVRLTADRPIYFEGPEPLHGG
jgi:hypothetical protein